jgi:glutaredoxin-related protein
MVVRKNFLGKRIVLILVLVISLFFVLACTLDSLETDESLESEEGAEEELETDEREGEELDEENTSMLATDVNIMYTDEGVGYLVDPNEILSGGPRKGGIGVDIGIPALSDENINFVTVSEADTFISDDELVLALHYNDEKRVYPLQIMVWHEIANDEVGGETILVTYCPLCGSGIAYLREINIDGEKVEVEFGTSGKLYNSNLVMYDDETNTYWQQIDGKAIVGYLVGEELEEINIDTVVWRDYKDAHSDAMVLSQETGMSRSYGTDPYGSYYENSLLFFSVENEDDSIHPKTVIYGIEIDGKYKAYIEEDIIDAGGKIEDTFAGVDLVILRDSSGIVSVVDKDSESEIVKERDFFFAWYAFHPDTEVYGK